MLTYSYITLVHDWLAREAEKEHWSSKETQRLRDMFDASSEYGKERYPRAPLQDPERWYMPGLAAQPFHDARDFPFIQHLEKARSDIEKEYVFIERSGLMKEHRKNNSGEVTTGWSGFFMYHRWGIPSPHAAMVPRTIEALSYLPGLDQVGSAFFSKVAPKSRIDAHHGEFNIRLRLHLPLDVPENCGIRVGNEEQVWHAGKCLVFDDSFLHSVWNDSDRPRVVLLADFWHPELTAFERRVLARIISDKNIVSTHYA